MRSKSTPAQPAGQCNGPAAPGVGEPFPAASREARKLAAAVLEVLAGALAPGDAAREVGVSLARYYQLELRALSGLVAACEARRRARGRAPGDDPASLRRECERLRRECARQQALARAARRAIGLSPAPPAPAAEGGPKRRKRRPTARALRVAAQLKQGAPDPPPSGAVPPVAIPPDLPAPPALEE